MYCRLLVVWTTVSLLWMSALHPAAFLMACLTLGCLFFEERLKMSLKGLVGVLLLFLGTSVILSRTLEEAGHFLGTGSLGFAILSCSLLALSLLCKKPEGYHFLPVGLSGLSLVACAMSSNFNRVLAFASVATVLLGLAFREKTKLKNSWGQLLPMLAVLAIMISTVFGAKWSESKLGFLMNQISSITMSGIRFPPSSGLDSLQKWNQSDVVVFRAYTEELPPRYLVGRTFSEYNDTGSGKRSFWRWKPTKQELQPETENPCASLSSNPTFKLFAKTPGPSKSPGKPLRVEFPGGGSGFTFYLPRNYFGILTDTDRLHRYSDGMVQVLARDHFNGTYEVYPDLKGWDNQATPVPLSEKELTEYTQLPDDLSPVVEEFARKFTSGANTTAKKAAFVTHHLQNDYEYGYGYPFEPKDDALEIFLTEKPAVHCEFFATAAALMLRTQGIPTRYINGFVVQEQDYSGDYYVIRLKHAHAWIEVYEPDVGWVTYDPTPPGTLDSMDQRGNFLSGLFEKFSDAWRRLVSFLTSTPSQMLAQIKAYLSQLSLGDLARLLPFVALYFLGRWWLNRRKKKSPIDIGVGEFQAPRHASLSPLLDRLNSSIQPPESRRKASETLGEWQRRMAGFDSEPEAIQQLQACLRRFERLRYNDEVTPQELSALKEQVNKLTQVLEGMPLKTRERPLTGPTP